MKNVVLSYCLFGCKHNSSKTEHWHIYITPETNPPRLYWITTAFIRVSLSLRVRVCLCVESLQLAAMIWCQIGISVSCTVFPSVSHTCTRSLSPSIFWLICCLCVNTKQTSLGGSSQQYQEFSVMVQYHKTCSLLSHHIKLYWPYDGLVSSQHKEASLSYSWAGVCVCLWKGSGSCCVSVYS